MTEFTTRTNATPADREPADHYVNVYFQDRQIGYLVLDKFVQLVEFLQKDEQNATKLIKNCTATYRERELGYKHCIQTRLTKDTVTERLREPLDMWAESETFIDSNIQIVLDRLNEYYG